MAVQDPTKCDVCGASLERGYSQRYRGKELLRTFCLACDEDVRFGDYALDGRLRTSLVTTASLRLFHARKARVKQPLAEARLALCDRIAAEAAAVTAALKRFEAAVWFGGLQALVRAAPTSGMKATAVPSAHGPTDLLTLTSAGRAVMTLDAPTCSVTVITAEDEATPRMGLQGIDATAAEAVALLDAVTAAWVAGGARPVPDGKVGMF